MRKGGCSGAGAGWDPLWIHPLPALCWQKVIFRQALEVPKIAKDQDVPGSGQLQIQGVAGSGNLANFPPADRAGLSPGAAWTGRDTLTPQQPETGRL